LAYFAKDPKKQKFFVMSVHIFFTAGLALFCISPKSTHPNEEANRKIVFEKGTINIQQYFLRHRFPRFCEIKTAKKLISKNLQKNP
jgi:hypothetical protein